MSSSSSSPLVSSPPQVLQSLLKRRRQQETQEAAVEEEEVTIEEEEEVTIEEEETKLAPKDYSILNSTEISEKLMEWEALYGNRFVTLQTSQERFGLPAAGGPDDCTFWTEQDGCPNFILTIQDYFLHPIDSSSSNVLPEVFWSGCLHGDELVGPTVTMEAVDLLLKAADCESIGPDEMQEEEEEQKQQQQKEQQKEPSCRQALRTVYGINDAQRKWLARLVSTRRIVVVPTANALGYDQNKHGEDNIDPNQDFPYDITNPAKCMQTITARTLNEVYRQHMFQLALTFHSGSGGLSGAEEVIIGYEWGSPTWYDHHHLSPDDTAQSTISASYSRYGGSWSNSKPYNYGTMNDLVYYIRGGMEDWAYAGSWDLERVTPCEPTTFDGYPKQKTTYDESTLRVFNMLIEASETKNPKDDEFGNSWNVVSSLPEDQASGNGHISRNIRLALLSVELVQPYVSIVGVEDVFRSDPDIIPSNATLHSNCWDSMNTSPSYRISHEKMILLNNDNNDDKNNGIDIHFTVGGSNTIDQVELWYAKVDDLPDDFFLHHTWDCLGQPTKEQLDLDQFRRLLEEQQQQEEEQQQVDGEGGVKEQVVDEAEGVKVGEVVPEDEQNGENEKEKVIWQRAIITSQNNGFGTFSKTGSQPKLSDESIKTSTTNGPIFTGTIPLLGESSDSSSLSSSSSSSSSSLWNLDDRLIIFASARVDQDWLTLPENVGPENTPPQSHVVNTRTNPDWYHEQRNTGKIIQGRMDWISIPMTVVFSDLSRYGDGDIAVQEWNVRFPNENAMMIHDIIDEEVVADIDNTYGINYTSIDEKSLGLDGMLKSKTVKLEDLSNDVLISIALGLLVLCCCCIYCCCCRKRNGQKVIDTGNTCNHQQQRYRDNNDHDDDTDDNEFGSLGGYTDEPETGLELT